MASPATWSVVIPYYNEAAFLPATIASLLRQTVKPFELILVDNGSTDGSGDLARDALEGVGDVRTVFLLEERKGQAHALEAGIGRASGAFTAICDADTIYPPHYLEAAGAVYERAPASVAAVLAVGVGPRPDSVDGRAKRLKTLAMGRLLAKQCHSGGYAHTFRTATLKRAGGYSKALWPYVLKDHELMHRISKLGDIRYAWDLWCQPSDRRADRSGVRWTLPERLLYHATPFRRKDWFFYEFFGPRLKARNMDEIRLRNRSWGEGGESV